MNPLPGVVRPSRLIALGRHSAALMVGSALLLSLAGPVGAADPSPGASPPTSTSPGLTMDARALLDGHVRPGAWAAVTVRVTNDGPSVSGELRIRSTQQGRSQYGVAVELPSGARQEHTLYAQTALFGSRLNVDLVIDGVVRLTQELRVTSHDVYTPIIAVVAERPEGIVPAINQAMRDPNISTPTVLTLRARDLPPRVEAWSAIDRLVWQDEDASLLTSQQLDALRLWLGAGGRLVIVGGTTGVGTVRSFPPELLPYTPELTVDVATADLTALLGSLPADAASVPALAGRLRAGSVLARSGDHVIAAQLSVGQGSVTLIGVNPAERWIANSPAGPGLWRRLVPLGTGANLNPINLTDDSMLVGALNNLPSVALPPIEQLFLLLFAYIALIGPINYLVLRRLDRREWAWVTMPLLVGVFAVASYGMGAALKGSDVIVNQIAIVRASQGTDRGLGQVYVGIFSPSRRTFDVRIAGGALLSNPTSLAQLGQAEQPLDVLFGDPSRLRNFEVGFGVLRGFRADAPADSPTITSDLRLTRGRLQGTVTNGSAARLENVAVVYAGGVAVLPRLEPGETRTIDIDTANSGAFSFQLSERVFGSTFPRDPAEARTVYTRRAVIDQITNYGANLQGSSATPVLLAWRQGSVLEVDVGEDRPNRVGESLYLVPLAMTHDSQALFGDRSLAKTVLESSSGEAWGDGSGYYMSRGTMTLETRPIGIAGTFHVTALDIALTQGEVAMPRGNGIDLPPLPDSEQPDQEDPVGTEIIDRTGGGVGDGGEGGEGGAGDDPVKPGEPFPFFDNLPDLQLFDHAAGMWVEFEHPNASQTYRIGNPDRYVDTSGRLLARFVNRGEGEEQNWFQFLVRMEGTLQ